MRILNRRSRFWKLEDFEQSDAIVDILATPVEGELQMLARVEKVGATEDEIALASAAFRLRAALVDAFGGVQAMPADIRKMLDLDEPKPKRATNDIKRTHEAIEQHKAQIAKASETMEEKVSRLNAVTKSIERLDDERALERINAAAARLRKADPNLTKSEAVVKACKDDPALYASYQRDMYRKMGVLDDSPERIKKAEDAEALLNKAAEPYLAADPSLTREQARAKAIYADPSLYERTST